MARQNAALNNDIYTGVTNRIIEDLEKGNFSKRRTDR
ncbi:hypothetical protein C8J33_11228 [Rhizobium sp. PP-CC-3G-465]|nr:hypothetical protein C8J33_11228 [Rhizobium sp. PP-CC-3G-465]